MTKKSRVLSGIRATGKLHVGNYLGALKQFADMQKSHSHECYFFIADLHALTTPFNPKDLSASTIEVVAEYLAAGIDPDKSVIFLQNHIAAHTQLSWIFNCITPLGELERQTAYKDKSAENKTSVNAGLLTYPALMAADILLYQPQFVPVGEDQQQHLELARTIARKFNSQFGKTFIEPRALLQKPLRIMSLSKPEKKMSKTNDVPLYISDTPEIISAKIKKAVTAPDSKSHSPGADNLFYLLSEFANLETVKYFQQEKQNGTLKFSELKDTLAKSISEYFSDFRKMKSDILKNKNYLAHTLAQGAEKARTVADSTLSVAKKKVGLI